MTRTPAPADTRMMDIVHSALKRDLARARAVVGSASPPRGRQRVALGRHVGWMMEFLHAHHTSEDAGLWPVVRSRNPAAAEMLDAMEADHARIAPAADALTAAAAAYTVTTDDGARVRLAEAIDELTAVLVPHLDREVAEVMPLVATSITADEWDAIEQEHNIKPKTTRQLATEGHWLIEDIDAEGYDVVVHKVPTILRFVLIHGFGPGYRRQARARWTPDASPTPATAT